MSQYVAECREMSKNVEIRHYSTVQENVLPLKTQGNFQINVKLISAFNFKLLYCTVLHFVLKKYDRS
jgi:hypothetical protein